MTERLDRDGIDWGLTTWEGNRRAQMEHWALMSLDRILQAQEEMAELSRDLARQSGDITLTIPDRPPGLCVAEERAAYVARSQECYDIPLRGCTPEPLMAYLKALGILRLVSEQKDPESRGCWRNEVFWLHAQSLIAESDADDAQRTKLVDFFLNEYEPTPIIGPWAGGSGFFGNDNREAVDALSNTDAARVGLFVQVIRNVQAILREEGVDDKPTERDKARLIRRFRRELPDRVVAWMDSAMVLQQDGQGFAPLLGTGGNDGRLDFTQNFMQRIVALGLHVTNLASDQSRTWLHNALFAESAKLNSASIGQFAPGRAGGPNATQGMEGGSIDNPWDFVLMLEGALLFAGAAVRRFRSSGPERAAFPFTVRPVAAGFDASTSHDLADSRGEIWLPLWNRPATAAEVGQLLGEGRADVSGRAARDGSDFARAVATLGVDRGVSGFIRVAFLKRSGKAYLAAPIGRFAVTERAEVGLLHEVDSWLDRFRSACSAKDAPARFDGALRAIDSAVFDFCKYGGNSFFQRILVALGRAERELGTAARFRDKQNIRPVSGLSYDWLDAANDSSPEFALALGLASIHDPEQQIGPLRANLESVDWQKRCRVWAQKDRAAVWNAGDVPRNLTNVLDRRMMDGERTGCERLPLASRFTVPLDTVAAFIDGALDDGRIEDLIWGLMLVDPRWRTGRERVELNRPVSPPPLPRAYALLKLLFLPRPLVPERAGDQVRWRFAREGEVGVTIRAEPRIPRLLRGGRIGEACRIAAERLRASGLPSMPRPLPTGLTRDREWVQRKTDARRGQRLAAALLVPVSSSSVNRLVGLVCCDMSAAAETFAMPTEGGAIR